MKRVVAGMIVVAFIFLGLYGGANATNTPEEAKAMAEKAYNYLMENGKQKAFKEISNREGQFVKGDLYVFVLDFKGINLANGGNPSFVGISHIDLKDPDGKEFIKEMVELAKTKGTGWVEYKWLNPTTKKIQQKTTYVKKIEKMNAFVACGALK
jgi:cytochrome c